MDHSEIREPVLRSPVRDAVLQEHLVARRQRLHAAATAPAGAEQVVRLIQEIDAALARMEAGTYGLCETCHDDIESERLLADPLCRYCLSHLTAAEQAELERDLDLALQIQRGLLPKLEPCARGWKMAYHYQPVGPVSGDYCDLIVLDDGSGLFLLGDVSGKGVAASMLMAHLHAIIRSLTGSTRRVSDLVARANRVFCEGTLASFFATLVCGWLGRDGDVEICNAGHCYPLHLHGGRISSIESTGLPLGLFAGGEYASHRTKAAPGDTLVVYSDGLSETFNAGEEQYGAERLAMLLERQRTLPPRDLVAVVLDDVRAFRGSAPPTDDLTLMIIRRES